MLCEINELDFESENLELCRIIFDIELFTFTLFCNCMFRAVDGQLRQIQPDGSLEGKLNSDFFYMTS